MDTRVDGSWFKCGCYALVIGFNLILGGWSVNYLLLFFLENTLPFFWATVIGLFVGQFSVPVAIIVKILESFGIV